MPFHRRLRFLAFGVGGALLLVVGAIVVNRWIARSGQAEHRARESWVAPDRSLVRFTLGYDEVLADSLWLRLIQDLGVCEQKRLAPGEPRTGVGRARSDCEFGWGYHMVDVITELAPRFNMAYYAGASALSVIADDIKGASAIYIKGVPHFPEDWAFLYLAASHFLVEVGDEERAADLFKAAGKAGAPGWVMALAARLYSRVGKLMVARQTLTDFIENNPDNKFIERAKMRLREVDELLAKER